MTYMYTRKYEYRVIHPRIPDDLHRRLVEYAERTHRSLTKAVEHLLEAGLAAEGDGA